MAVAGPSRRARARVPGRAARSELGSINRSPGDPARNVDWMLVTAVVGIAALGVVAIYSASRVKNISNALDPFIYAQRQVVFLIIGAAVMAGVMAVDYHALKERATLLYGASLGGLVLVLMLGGVTGSARLSFDLGPINIQPAEATKLTALVMLAAYLSEVRGDELPYHSFLTGLLITAPAVGLVILQPDLGSASVIVAMTMGVLLVAGAKLRHMLLVSSLGLATAIAAVTSGLVERYQVQRFTAFLNQNYSGSDDALRDLVNQGRYAKQAVATGGLSGKGFLEAPLTNGKFIPVQHTDFVFSAVAEQFGLLGAGLLIGLFAWLLWRIWRIANLAKDALGTYLCAGVFTMVAWHAFQNIGMTMGIMPITGIPLPLVSYGGSSTVAFMAMFGLVESVHMRRWR
jgi:rod shape determining protein RodA